MQPLRALTFQIPRLHAPLSHIPHLYALLIFHSSKHFSLVKPTCISHMQRLHALFPICHASILLSYAKPSCSSFSYATAPCSSHIPRLHTLLISPAATHFFLICQTSMHFFLICQASMHFLLICHVPIHF